MAKQFRVDDLIINKNHDCAAPDSRDVLKEEREVGCYANRGIGPARCQGADEEEIAISDIEEI